MGRKIKLKTTEHALPLERGEPEDRPAADGTSFRTMWMWSSVRVIMSACSRNQTWLSWRRNCGFAWKTERRATPCPAASTRQEIQPRRETRAKPAAPRPHPTTEGYPSFVSGGEALELSFDEACGRPILRMRVRVGIRGHGAQCGPCLNPIGRAPRDVRPLHSSRLIGPRSEQKCQVFDFGNTSP
jgi:hypothetical protein